MKIFKFEKFINESDMNDLISRATKFENESRFIRLGDELIMAGKSKYPVGTKIKIKNLKGDDSDLSGLTGTLTHPFGGYGDVGVYLDQKGLYNDDKICLRNREYEVIDDEAIELLKKYKFDNTVKKYNL